jgi:uncharacterized membrane protein YeaQ/YmgE (transglycosylase-associated protein family)
VGIVVFIIIGIIAGYLARLILPGKQELSFVRTALLGMAGSLVGGTVASLFADEGLAISGAGIIGSVLGALLVLFLLQRAGKV